MSFCSLLNPKPIKLEAKLNFLLNLNIFLKILEIKSFPILIAVKRTSNPINPLKLRVFFQKRLTKLQYLRNDLKNQWGTPLDYLRKLKVEYLIISLSSCTFEASECLDSLLLSCLRDWSLVEPRLPSLSLSRSLSLSLSRPLSRSERLSRSLLLSGLSAPLSRLRWESLSLPPLSLALSLSLSRSLSRNLLSRSRSRSLSLWLSLSLSLSWSLSRSLRLNRSVRLGGLTCLACGDREIDLDQDLDLDLECDL